jgi:hypothetical protein
MNLAPLTDTQFVPLSKLRRQRLPVAAGEGGT